MLGGDNRWGLSPAAPGIAGHILQDGEYRKLNPQQPRRSHRVGEREFPWEMGGAARHAAVGGAGNESDCVNATCGVSVAMRPYVVADVAQARKARILCGRFDIFDELLEHLRVALAAGSSSRRGGQRCGCNHALTDGTGRRLTGRNAELAFRAGSALAEGLTLAMGHRQNQDHGSDEEGKAETESGDEDDARPNRQGVVVNDMDRMVASVRELARGPLSGEVQRGVAATVVKMGEVRVRSASGQQGREGGREGGAGGGGTGAGHGGRESEGNARHTHAIYLPAQERR